MEIFLRLGDGREGATNDSQHRKPSVSRGVRCYCLCGKRWGLVTPVYFQWFGRRRRHPGTAVAVVGCVLSAAIFFTLTLLAWRLCRRKRVFTGSYEHIASDQRHQQPGTVVEKGNNGIPTAPVK
ncbi:hypothetical protein ACOMHN_046407 [Nucella lapillus]